MTFEFTYQKENKKVSLTKEEQKSVVDTINSNFKKWDDMRYLNLSKSERLNDEILFKTGKTSRSLSNAR